MSDAVFSPVNAGDDRRTYVPVEGHWDEAALASGRPRRQWRPLAISLGRMEPRHFDHLWRRGQKLIQSNGITYNVYGDPLGKERFWSMDPIPLMVADSEWTRIERAVAQRARLLNAMLGDLYGEQRLVHDRWLPPAFVFGNPHFLRPCCGIQPPGGVFLHSYAADLARSPDGRWWVINDRVQAPSGIGYALENRLVSARTLPSLFMQCRVRQLGRFFQTAKEALLALGSGSKTTPRVVLLSPGPHNETYFEQSFLASHYGFTLVEGADLTVREERVFLKTLAGLDPVDIILRRQDDGFCDPLELRGDSVLGVPGLLQAVRAGSVTVANALGSGVLETPAHMAFLPGLSRHLLSEDLLMPSVATWWCGQEGPRRYVLDHLDQLVIKPCFPGFGQHPEFPARLSSAERRAVRERIENRPDLYVAQEQVALSTAPVWTEEGLTPRHVVLRVFAAWDGRSYTVMPGGLTRISTATSSLVVSMQQGGGSKDTWVVNGSEESAPPAARRSAPKIVPDRTMGSDVPSRVADNFFWLGRYAERVESAVRLARVLLPSLSGEEDFGQAVTLETGLRLLAGFRLVPVEVLRNSIAEQRRHLERTLTALVRESSWNTGIPHNLRQVRRVAWQLKEKLSADAWRVLNQMEADFSRAALPPDQYRLLGDMDLLDRSVTTLSAFSGLLLENTTRSLGWRFLDIGRRLERGIHTIELLLYGLAGTSGDVEPYLEMLLHIADSTITYRRRYFSVLRTDLVLDLLLADEANPRSVGFQLAMLAEHVEKLPERETDARHPLERRLALRAISSVRLAHLDALGRLVEGRREELAVLLESLRHDLFGLSEALTAKYLSHVTPSRLMASS